MSQLPISNIINVSIAQVQVGANEYNTSNLAIFTNEIPNSETFGVLGYAIYLSPDQVETDFGSNSTTFAMANAVFSQQPNILLGGGALIIILMNVSSQHLALSGVAASGSFEIVSSNGTTAGINWNDTADMIQAKVQAVPGQGQWLVSGSIASQTLDIQCAGSYGPQAAFTIAANSLQTSAPAAITFIVSSTQAGETIGEAITRTQNLVQYFGIMVNEDVTTIGQTDVLAAAAIVQPLIKVVFWVSSNSADVAPGGLLDLLRTGSFSHSRGLYYNNTNLTPAVVMMSAYAGLALSTNFEGSNTTQTMNLKQLIGVQVDTSITQTLFNQAVNAGVDTYPSLQGVPAVISAGANTFFDQIYGTLWLAGALQVAGFNYLQGTNTKIPQTESGMDGLKGAYRNVCQQAVTNQFSAPGQWNSPTTFGNQAQLLLNIGQFGYYIYSVPIAQQSQSSRAQREAPLVSIAIKLAGAIQSSSVVVYINQ